MVLKSFSRGELWLGTSFSLRQKAGSVVQLGIRPMLYYEPDSMSFS